MTRDQRDDAALEALFDAGRDGPAVTDDFMARLAADMENALPQPDLPTPVKPPRRNWLAGVFAASGLSGAALAGVWIGFAMPQTLEFTTETEAGFELSYLLPGADLGSVFDE
ncbi:MAG: hypothetical protein OIF48_09650 [Silicimonas sp.]|nr:hypothetical protein [Silicimonas sp.]